MLSLNAIDVNASPSSKAEAIDCMTRLMEKSGNLNDREAYRQGVLAREEEGTTGIGEGIAIPHAKCAAVKRAGLAAAVIKGGVDYESLDGEPAELIFMIAAPETGANVHLEALAKLSTILMDTEFKDALVKAETPEQFVRMIDEKEDELDGKKAKKALEQPGNGYRVLAITACPTGIAHTFMAAESLEMKGKQMNISIKVETQGAGFFQNSPDQCCNRQTKTPGQSICRRQSQREAYEIRRSSDSYKSDVPYFQIPRLRFLPGAVCRLRGGISGAAA